MPEASPVKESGKAPPHGGVSLSGAGTADVSCRHVRTLCLNATAGDLIEHFGLTACAEWNARYNIAPQSSIPVIRLKPGAGRVGQLVRWGLIPSWAKDPGIGNKLNNARSETVADKPAFRSSFRRHRCLIPANGFYEWQAVPMDGKVRKQPWSTGPSPKRVVSNRLTMRKAMLRVLCASPRT